jgi:predicted DNA-binding ribbon-helix-helix protein
VSVNSGEEYEVGYRKPPKATRFQKGKSGNPSGRPKRAAPDVNPGMVLQSIDNEKIVLTIDGKRKSMLKVEVYFRQLFSKAIRGDLTAARLVAKMAAEYFGPEAEGPSDTYFKVVPDEYFENRYQMKAKGKS